MYQYKNMNKIIRNDQLNIDSNDVRQCSDLISLMRWRIEVAKTINEIADKLTQARAQRARTKVPADRDWYDRHKSAFRLQEILLMEIELKIEQLKKEQESQ